MWQESSRIMTNIWLIGLYWIKTKDHKWHLQLFTNFLLVIIQNMSKDGKSLFRIPKVKDDVLRIVCVILNIFISGKSWIKNIINRFWYYCWWYLRWYWCYGHSLWCSPTCVRWFRPWLHLVLGLGLLHCCPEASLLSE